jgi:hypothetical protein
MILTSYTELKRSSYLKFHEQIEYMHQRPPEVRAYMPDVVLHRTTCTELGSTIS